LLHERFEYILFPNVLHMPYDVFVKRQITGLYASIVEVLLSFTY
jgi:hypothetical protein